MTVVNHLDVLKQQIREGHVQLRIEGHDSSGKTKRWVEIDARPSEDGPDWMLHVKMGDGTKYDKKLPAEGLEDALTEFFLKLKAAFERKAKHGLS